MTYSLHDRRSIPCQLQLILLVIGNGCSSCKHLLLIVARHCLDKFKQKLCVQSLVPCHSERIFFLWHQFYKHTCTMHVMTFTGLLP